MDPIAEDIGKSILRQRTTEPTPPECGICGRSVVHTENDRDFHCPNCDNTWQFTVTNHAAQRWEQRSATPERDILDAWDNGIRFIDEGTRVKGDEFRYEHRSLCVLIRKNSSLVTVEYVPETRVQIQRATVRSLIADDANQAAAIANVCNKCNISVDKLKEIARYEQGIINDIQTE